MADQLAPELPRPAEAAPGGIADPAPLGLAGFALTTMLLSGVNTGKIDTGGLIFVGMALAYGGLGQFMAGMWEFKRNNTFGATAFSSFGAFWMGTGILFLVGDISGKLVDFGVPGSAGFTWFLFAWAIFTTYMWVASFRVSGAVMAVFFLLAITFWMLWIGSAHHDAGGVGWTDWGGIFGFLTAGMAAYTSFAGVTNSTFGRTVLPVFPMNLPALGRTTTR